MAEWTHTALRQDLARSRIGTGEIVVEEIALARGISTPIYADVFAMRPSRTQPTIRLYEVKATRADFLSDIRSGKHRLYEEWGTLTTFAVPKGLVRQDEVPEDWGLVFRGPERWYTVKAPRPRFGRDGNRHLAVEPSWRDLMLSVLLSLHPLPATAWRKSREARLSSLMNRVIPRGGGGHARQEWFRSLARDRISEGVAEVAEENQTLRIENRALQKRVRELEGDHALQG